MRTKIALAAVLLALTACLMAQQAVQITQGPRVESVSGDTAIVAWSTNANAGTQVRYGTDPNNLSQTAQAPWGGVTHRVTISNLQPNTTYYFQVDSGQGQGTGTSVSSQVAQFTTGASGAAAVAPPRGQRRGRFESGAAAQQSIITSLPGFETVDQNSAVLRWNTSVPSSAVVRYGTNGNDLNNLSQIARAPWGGVEHRVTLTGLQPDTTYYFQIKAGQAQGSGTSSYSQFFSFRTPPAGAAPMTNVQPTLVH